MSESETQSGDQPVDELRTFDAQDAIQTGTGVIKCPNGCYDPIELTWQSLRTAAENDTCDDCGAIHHVVWGEERDNTTESTDD